jgi:hypothetical protein
MSMYGLEDDGMRSHVPCEIHRKLTGDKQGIIVSMVGEETPA